MTWRWYASRTVKAGHCREGAGWRQEDSGAFTCGRTREYSGGLSAPDRPGMTGRGVRSKNRSRRAARLTAVPLVRRDGTSGPAADLPLS